MAENETKRKDRDEQGKFVKGHKVPSPRRGRPTRGDVMPVLTAITQAAYTAEELVSMIHDTYNMAVAEKDWKGMFTVINFVVQYAVGKPVQRTLSATIDPNALKELFGGTDDSSTNTVGEAAGTVEADVAGRTIDVPSAAGGEGTDQGDTG